MPSHPSLVTQQQQQKTKKTWLDTVAGAFQKEPLSLQDLDLLSKQYKRKYMMDYILNLLFNSGTSTNGRSQ